MKENNKLTGPLKVFLWVGIFYLGFILIESIHLLHRSDKSIQSSYYLSSKNGDEAPPPVYLVSYADKHEVFLKNQNAQALSAVNNGIDFIMMYKRRDIDADFYARNKEILDVPAGAGLWLWKAYFMLKTMDAAPKDSIIIYADSPVIFRKPIKPFVELLKKHDIILLRDGSQRKGNVRKVSDVINESPLNAYNLNNEAFKNKDNIWSCLVMVRNNETGRTLVEQWLKNCQKGPRDTAFYDQTLLLIAAHQKPNGVYVMDVDEFTKVAKNVHRHPVEEHKSLLPDIISRNASWYKVSEWGYNAKWMQWIRSLLSWR